MLSKYLLEEKNDRIDRINKEIDLQAIEELSFSETVLSFHISSSNLTARSTDFSSD